MKRRLIIAGIVVLLLAGLVTLLWTALDLPPPRLILRYGLPSQGGLTGQTRLIAGMEFVKVEAGYRWVWRPPRGEGTLEALWRSVKQTLGFEDQRSRFNYAFTEDPIIIVMPSDALPESGWAEVCSDFWITKERVEWTSLYNCLDPGAPRIISKEQCGLAVEMLNQIRQSLVHGRIGFCSLEEWEFAVLPTPQSRFNSIEAIALERDPLVLGVPSFWYEVSGGYKTPGTSAVGIRLVWLPPEED